MDVDETFTKQKFSGGQEEIRKDKNKVIGPNTLYEGIII
jgi:hypothetical protein